MQNIISKINQRNSLANKIRVFIIDGSTGNLTLNDAIKVNFSNKRVDNFVYEEKTYDITKITLGNIIKIKNIDVSVMLEEVYKICSKVNSFFN
jgi:ribosome-binding protein aMBF1 (putative translation factor)